MTEPSSIDLADAIRTLRHQLSTAMGEGREDELKFGLGEVHLEFEVVVSRDVSADGGVRFGVVSLGARGNIGREATHRISLVMHPVVVHPDGSTSPARIAGSGASEPV